MYYCEKLIPKVKIQLLLGKNHTTAKLMSPFQ